MSLKFNLNITEARKFKIPGKLLLSADAVKIFHFRQQLRDRDIQIEIVPEYPYEVWDDNPQGEFPSFKNIFTKYKSTPVSLIFR